MVSDGTRQAFEAAEMMFFGIMTDITSHKTVQPHIIFLENATVRGRDWYKLLDAPVLILDVTV